MDKLLMIETKISQKEKKRFTITKIKYSKWYCSVEFLLFLTYPLLQLQKQITLNT